MTKANMPVIELLQQHDEGDFLRAVTEGVNERSKLTRLQHLILTRLSDGKAPRRAALI